MHMGVDRDPALHVHVQRCLNAAQYFKRASALCGIRPSVHVISHSTAAAAAEAAAARMLS
jgi:hypothetical protein